MSTPSLCETCHHWKRQNSQMGHCRYPLPEVLKEIVGAAVMKKGVYAWKGQVHGGCFGYRAEQAPVS